MPRLAPYQAGVWIAEYLNRRCQLCRIYPSLPVIHPDPLTATPISQVISRFNSGLLCPCCQDSLSWQPAPFTVDIAPATSLSIQAATYYNYPIRPIFSAFKHSEDMTTLPLLVHILRQLPRPKGCHSTNSVIVPMPTTSRRLVKRGFDPVTILAAYLSNHWQIPLWHGVVRVDSALSQQGLSRAERLTNLNDAFMVVEALPTKRLLLFDDVATTGASLQALARTLHTYAQSTGNQPSSHPSLVNTITPYHISAYALAHGNGSTT